MQLVNHPFVKFDQLKPIYNFTYPLFRQISDDLCGYLNLDELVREGRIPPSRSTSLYLHIPFCDTICSFCPFQKGAYKTDDQVETYIAALQAEILAKSRFVRSLAGPIRSIYVGGGTPSIMTADNIRSVGDLLHREFDMSSVAEFTFECEPKSVTEEKLHAAKEIGVNRISFGVQTFTKRFRNFFNLTSTRQNIENSVKWSQNIIGRVGFDMLYGMHGQTAEEMFYDLKEATELLPETINFYPINNIAITPGLHKSYAAQSMKPSSLAHRQMLRLFGDIFLRECGFSPCNGHSYIKGANELPMNAAGMSSANNFRYHKYLHGYNDDYIVGFGASAQSILGTLVTRANPNRSGYISDAHAKGGPKVHYNWGPEDQRASKAICMRLPYSGYVDKKRIDWKSVDPFVRKNLQQVVDAGLVTETDDELVLTRQGWQWYSNLMYFLLPQADRNIVNTYVEDMMKAPILLDGPTEVFVAA